MLKYYTLFFAILLTSPFVEAQNQDSSKKINPLVSTTYVEQMPEFPGGNEALLKFLNENLEYPEEARKNGVEGKVVSQFIVNQDGTLSDVKIIRPLGAGCEQEVLRLISQMPKWNPGKLNGEAVKVAFTLPVVFKLGE